jgi:hypothetical protein
MLALCGSGLNDGGSVFIRNVNVGYIAHFLMVPALGNRININNDTVKISNWYNSGLN